MVKADDQLSFSIGQFDINDTIDSAEMRLEYLSAKIFTIIILILSRLLELCSIATVVSIYTLA